MIRRLGCIANNVRRTRRSAHAQAGVGGSGRQELGGGCNDRWAAAGRATDRRGGTRLGDGHPALLQQANGLAVLVVIVTDVTAFAAPTLAFGHGSEKRY